MGMGGGFAPGASPPRGPPKKAEPVEYNFNVTLEDLYTGGKNKKMRITKKVRLPSLPPSLPPSLLARRRKPSRSSIT
jgi:DnaJ-class molecular chaperone